MSLSPVLLNQLFGLVQIIFARQDGSKTKTKTMSVYSISDSDYDVYLGSVTNRKCWNLPTKVDWSYSGLSISIRSREPVDCDCISAEKSIRIYSNIARDATFFPISGSENVFAVTHPSLMLCSFRTRPWNTRWAGWSAWQNYWATAPRADNKLIIFRFFVGFFDNKSVTSLVGTGLASLKRTRSFKNFSVNFTRKPLLRAIGWMR